MFINRFWVKLPVLDDDLVNRVKVTVEGTSVDDVDVTPVISTK